MASDSPDLGLHADDVADVQIAPRSSAIVLDSGEVVWPFHAAGDAIDDLAAPGRVVLGVDARERDDAGLVTEVPISDPRVHAVVATPME